MKSFFRMVLTCALGLSTTVGCSETSGSAGSGGEGGSGGVAGASGNGGAGGTMESLDPLEGIGTVELVADGFDFIEGPLWRSDEQDLLFSDIPANMIYQMTPPDEVAVFRADSGQSNGLNFDADGLLLAAEHQNRRLSRTLEDGTIVTVASQYLGDPLNSPNDIAVRSDGTIYFTDPPFGISPSQQVLEFNGVFRVAVDGELTAEWEGAKSTRPNGVVLSPDEQILYVSDSSGGVMAFDVNPDGSLSAERPFIAELDVADGMAMDAAGNLFVTTHQGVEVFDSSGSPWGIIEVPDGRLPSNCAFGGADARTLYITAQQALYRVSLANPGLN